MFFFFRYGSELFLCHILINFVTKLGAKVEKNIRTWILYFCCDKNDCELRILNLELCCWFK